MLRAVLAGLLTVATCAACTDDERSADPTTTISKTPQRVDQCQPSRPLCLDQEQMTDLKSNLLIEPSDELIYAVRASDDSPTDAVFVVLQDAGGGRVGASMTDADQDGTFVDTNSQGLKPPAYVAPSLHSAVGTSFFTSEFFAFAATYEAEAVQVVLRTSAAERRIPINRNGVSDLTLEWRELRAVGERFDVEWVDPDGDVLDSLHGDFPGVVD